MSKINLNAEEFNKDRKIFNNGIAGVIKGVTIRVDKKRPDANPQAPPYQLVFIDPNGGEISQSIFYLGDPTGDPKVDKDRLVNLGATLKHIWGAVFGEKPIPEFESMKQAVDSVMASIATHAAENPDDKYDTVANYGTKERPRKWLTIKRFPPFIERSGLAANMSRLYLGVKDLTQPIVEDEPSTNTEAAHTDTADVTWPTS